MKYIFLPFFKYLIVFPILFIIAIFEFLYYLDYKKTFFYEMPIPYGKRNGEFNWGLGSMKEWLTYPFDLK